MRDPVHVRKEREEMHPVIEQRRDRERTCRMCDKWSVERDGRKMEATMKERKKES